MEPYLGKPDNRCRRGSRNAATILTISQTRHKPCRLGYIYVPPSGWTISRPRYKGRTSSTQPSKRRGYPDSHILAVIFADSTPWACLAHSNIYKCLTHSGGSKGGITVMTTDLMQLELDLSDNGLGISRSWAERASVEFTSPMSGRTREYSPRWFSNNVRSDVGVCRSELVGRRLGCGGDTVMLVPLS